MSTPSFVEPGMSGPVEGSASPIESPTRERSSSQRSTHERSARERSTGERSSSGHSDPVTAGDRLWRSAAAQLAPAPSLARADEHARLVLVVTSALPPILSAIGLLAAPRLEGDNVARLLMLAAIGCAVAAAGLAWGCQLLRMAARSDPVNLIDVRGWYQRQFRRAYGVWLAGGLALGSIVIAAAAVMAVLS